PSPMNAPSIVSPSSTVRQITSATGQEEQVDFIVSLGCENGRGNSSIFHPRLTYTPTSPRRANTHLRTLNTAEPVIAQVRDLGQLGAGGSTRERLVPRAGDGAVVPRPHGHHGRRVPGNGPRGGGGDEGDARARGSEPQLVPCPGARRLSGAIGAFLPAPGEELGGDPPGEAQGTGTDESHDIPGGDVEVRGPEPAPRGGVAEVHGPRRLRLGLPASWIGDAEARELRGVGERAAAHAGTQQHPRRGEEPRGDERPRARAGEDPHRGETQGGREREEEGKFDSGPGAAGGIGAHFEGRGAGAQPCPGPQVPPARGFPLDPRPRAPPAGAGAGGELLPGEVGIIDLGVGEQAAAHDHRRGWGQAPARGTEFDDAPGIGTRDRCQVYPLPHAPRFAGGGGTGRPHRRCCGRWGRCRHPGVDIPVWTARGYSSARAATGGTFVAERAGKTDASRPA